jgi:hypothetical protein
VGNFIKFDEELDKAVATNFDGQDKSLDIFRKCIDRNYDKTLMGSSSIKFQNPL